MHEEETAGFLAVYHANKRVLLGTQDNREAFAQEHNGAKLDMLVQHLGWSGKMPGQENKIKELTLDESKEACDNSGNLVKRYLEL